MHNLSTFLRQLSTGFPVIFKNVCRVFVLLILFLDDVLFLNNLFFSFLFFSFPRIKIPSMEICFLLDTVDLNVVIFLFVIHLSSLLTFIVRYMKIHVTLFCSLGALSHGRVKAKPFRVASFKGGIQNSDSGGGESGTKVSNNSVKLSYLPDDDENNINGPLKAQNTSLSYTSETEDSITGQPAIQKLFKKWLTMLSTQSSTKAVDDVLGEQLPQTMESETQTETQKIECIKGNQTIWSQLWCLDATIKIPLLLFVPGFLAVHAVYGAEVSKELLPLWVLGPLIVALYIKMFQGLCALYIFCFKQTAKVARNLPAYCLLVYNYIREGKLRDDVQAFVLRPMLAIKKMDYKEVGKMKLKELQEWIVEKYLDFVESIWPYYCRTVRFLKRANLI